VKHERKVALKVVDELQRLAHEEIGSGDGMVVKIEDVRGLL